VHSVGMQVQWEDLATSPGSLGTANRLTLAHTHTHTHTCLLV
jgi:hypothetical protein